MPVPPIPLSTNGYIDDAVAALQNSNVYVSDEVANAPALAQQLDQQVGDASIGVAVFSENAGLEGSASDIVRELASANPGYDTIVVAVGDDVAAGSNALAKGEALRIANEAENSSDSVDAALTQTVQQIIAETPATSSPGVDAGPVVGIGLTIAVLLGAGIAVVGVVRSRRRRASENRGLPDAVRAQVVALRGLVPEYAAVGASGNAVAAQTAQEIGVLADNVTELFNRLDRRSVEDQVNIAAVEYDDKLRKLTAALNRDYLLDILRHPNLWDDPDDRVREVQGALDGVSTELLENIKQVNARRGLHFQVSLDGLIGRRKELQDWDRAFDQASDDRPFPPPKPAAE
ncbi:hypothetical protein G5T42_06720 [Microbacterium sp. 4R-513]|uniref:hypothetical protein n=1 Tax=Microbacterium sp. 4R-513 TaxID=2567934 RepID=UPI0013E13B3C|nr:hypothetical protein [Microbacterium sp. 4R-513]QIG39215.1 hypothetical protein G5T42_06720 [Microbacterium sp. 4R-513]